MNNKAIVTKMKEAFKVMLEEMLQEERDVYLSEKSKTKGNGFYSRDLTTMLGKIEELLVPRTRDGEFRSDLIPYKRRNVVELEELMRAMFVSGVSTRKISSILSELYGTKYSATSVSRISQVAEEEIEKWRNRPIEDNFAVLFLDATFFPLKRDTVESEAIFVALGIRHDGSREILGFWIPGGDESAENWHEILKEIKGRGLKHLDLVVCDGLTGLKEVVKKVYRGVDFQSCLLHFVRNLLNKVRARDRQAFAYDLKLVYKAENMEKAEKELEAFTKKWKKAYPKLIKTITEKLADITTFLKYPKTIRGNIYTTNALERLMKEIKRRLKSMEMLQNEASADKMLYLILTERNVKYRSRKLRDWQQTWDEYKVCGGRHN